MEELSYKDLSELELDAIKDIYISRRISAMTENDLRKFAREIIVDQIKGTVGHEEEKEAWKEMKEHFDHNFEQVLKEVLKFLEFHTDSAAS